MSYGLANAQSNSDYSSIVDYKHVLHQKLLDLDLNVSPPSLHGLLILEEEEQIPRDEVIGETDVDGGGGGGEMEGMRQWGGVSTRE